MRLVICSDIHGNLPALDAVLTDIQRNTLLDPVSKSLGIGANSLVPRHDRDKLRRLIEELCGRQVDRVERPNRFDGKRPTNAVEHPLIDVEKEAASLEGPEGLYCGPLRFRCQPAGHASADDGPSRLRERQHRCHQSRSRRPSLRHSCVVLEKRSHQRTRFDIPDLRCGRRRNPRAPGPGYRRQPLRGLRLPHGLRQSAQRLYQAAGGCQASPQTGRHLLAAAAEFLPRSARPNDSSAIVERLPEERARRRPDRAPLPQSARRLPRAGCTDSSCP